MARITEPEATTATDPRASASEWRRTPSRFTSSRSPRASTQVAAALPASPSRPIARTPAPSTSGGSESRPTAAIATRTAITTNATPFTSAASTSLRWSPKVLRGPAGRVASAAAARPRRDRADVGEDVPGVGEQREGSGQEAADDRRREHRGVDRERDLHAPAVVGPARVERVVVSMAVVVRHGSKFRACSAGRGTFSRTWAFGFAATRSGHSPRSSPSARWWRRRWSGSARWTTTAARPLAPAPDVIVRTEEPAEEPTDLGFPAFATSNTTRVAGADSIEVAAGVALATFPTAGGGRRSERGDPRPGERLGGRDRSGVPGRRPDRRPDPAERRGRAARAQRRSARLAGAAGDRPRPRAGRCSRSGRRPSPRERGPPGSRAQRGVEIAGRDRAAARAADRGASRPPRDRVRGRARVRDARRGLGGPLGRPGPVRATRLGARGRRWR